MEPMVRHTNVVWDRDAGTGCNDDALARYHDNSNGRITCKEARRHGIAPDRQGHPAYRTVNTACQST